MLELRKLIHSGIAWHSRAYWQRVGANGAVPTARRALEEYWFGARSMARAEMLMAHLRTRYDAYPPALQVLKQWQNMAPDVRRLVCHWHLQLADPLYRAFTGQYLVGRHGEARTEVTRTLVVTWVEEPIGILNPADENATFSSVFLEFYAIDAPRSGAIPAV